MNGRDKLWSDEVKRGQRGDRAKFQKDGKSLAW